MTTKAKGSSVRQKIINRSMELGVPYQNLETSFILERFVARLTADAGFNGILFLRADSSG